LRRHHPAGAPLRQAQFPPRRKKGNTSKGSKEHCGWLTLSNFILLSKLFEMSDGSDRLSTQRFLSVHHRRNLRSGMQGLKGTVSRESARTNMR
jgi:hypothetical protein